jgi:hypothetical protein
MCQAEKYGTIKFVLYIIIYGGKRIFLLPSEACLASGQQSVERSAGVESGQQSVERSAECLAVSIVLSGQHSV